MKKDLLAKPHKCDLCGSVKEQREFACVAEEKDEIAVCIDCTVFNEKVEKEVRAESEVSAEDMYAGIKSVKDKLTREILMIEFGYEYFPDLVSLLSGPKNLKEMKTLIIKGEKII